jgi:glycosyltransferase involved in cell wall biosynthesis
MSAPIRILHVAESFATGVAGVVIPLSEHLLDSGHSVAIAYGVRPETPADVRSHLRKEVELFPLPWVDRTVREQLSAARALRQLVREWDPDVVHLHSSFAGLVGSFTVRGRPLVYSPHGYSFTRSSDSWLRRRAYRAAERYVSRRVAVVAAVSESEAAQARDAIGARNVDVVPNGIPALDPCAKPQVPEREQVRVVGMGRTNDQRQPDATGRILRGLKDVAEVEWIGGGLPGDNGTEILESHGVPVTGWLGHPEADERLAQATAYLHWSAWDGRALSVLEAMAHDVVVVASDIPANREVLGEEQVCASEQEAAELLRAVVTDAGVRERLLAAQRERRGAYSALEMSTRWEALYGRVVRLPANAVVAPEPGSDVSLAP